MATEYSVTEFDRHETNGNLGKKVGMSKNFQIKSGRLPNNEIGVMNIEATSSKDCVSTTIKIVKVSNQKSPERKRTNKSKTCARRKKARNRAEFFNTNDIYETEEKALRRYTCSKFPSIKQDDSVNALVLD